MTTGLIEYKGKSYTTQSGLAAEYGIPGSTLNLRVREGYSLEDAMDYCLAVKKRK